METRVVNVKGIPVGKGHPVVLIAGPCVIESEESAITHANRIKEIAEREGFPFIYKASFDKANRSSVDSYRGPGLARGIEILDRVRKETGVPVLSDVHTEDQIDMAAGILDILQIPAFLCRQTDLLLKAGKTGKPVNIKKGQFMSPFEMENVINKVRSAGNENIMLTERGTTFGYNMLINDFRSIVIMGELGTPVVYDATHSVQRPGGRGRSSGGDSQYVLPLSRAAVACGADALFLEVHEEPLKALSDGPNMVKLDSLGEILRQIKGIEKAVRQS